MEQAMDGLGRLKDRREAIIQRWKALAMAVYPERGVQFLAGEPDRFRNPVGHMVGESLEVLYDGLLAGSPADEMRRALDGIVRIRAVQALSPSAAVGFVFLLKQAIGEELGGDDARLDCEIDGTDLHERIDRLALEAFDLFIQCREQIYELRVREIRGRGPSPPGSLRAREIERSDRAGS